MRGAWSSLAIVFWAAAATAWGQTAADFSRADQLPLPSDGVWYRNTTGREECLCLNSGARTVAFEAGYAAEAGGVEVPTKLLFVDVDTGVHKDTIDLSDKITREILASSLAKWGELPGPLSESWGTISGIARPTPASASEASGGVRHTFYLRHQETGWLKPLIVENVRDAVGPGAVTRLGDSGRLLLSFLRLPPEAGGEGGTIHICLGPQVSAQFLNEVGFAYYGRKQYSEALTIFAQAVETDSSHVKAMYNAACMAALLEDTTLSLEYLAMLKCDGSAAALQSLAIVDADGDFDLIRPRSVFQLGLRSIRETPVEALRARTRLARRFVPIEGGTFRMGDLIGDGSKDGGPVHTVGIPSFYLDKYEVTQGEWTAVMGSSPSGFRGVSRPVEQVCWFDAVDFCNRLSVREGLEPCYTISGTSVICDFSRNGYRLPTEAEWEYAARGGTSSRGCEYAGGNDVEASGWYDGNSGEATHPVGGRAANELGLYDMSGNVAEWCWDEYGSYPSASQTDPRGPLSSECSSGECRVLRGGSWYSNARGLRVSDRNYNVADNRDYTHFGIRLARSRA